MLELVYVCAYVPARACAHVPCPHVHFNSVYKEKEQGEGAQIKHSWAARLAAHRR